MITKENNGTGITGSIYHFSQTTHRVFAASILLIVLRGRVRCSYRYRNMDLTENDLLFLTEGEPVVFDTEDCYILMFLIPASSLLNHQADIHCCSAVSKNQASYDTLRHIISDILLSAEHGGTFYELRHQALWSQCMYELLTRHLNVNNHSTGNMSGITRVSGLNQRSDNGLLSNPGQRSDTMILSDPRQKPDSQDISNFSHGSRETGFKEILEILERDYAGNLKLNELAGAYYYTPSYLSKLFVKYTGMHFSEYLTELRLKKALPLLLQTNLEIGIISDRSGFPNPRAFTQAFQKKYHMRPSRYRAEFLDISSEVQNTNIYENLRKARSLGLLDIFDQSEGQAADVIFPVGRTEVSWNLGHFDLNQTFRTSFSKKNNVLNVYHAKDLLLPEIQDEIRLMQKNIGFEYLNCHNLFSDDMQIVFEDHLGFYEKDSPNTPNRKRRIHYNFSLYIHILQFAKELGLKFILQLGYTPYFFTRKHEKSEKEMDPAFMPADIDMWDDYISQFCTALHNHLGDWLFDCPVLLWQVPEVHISTFKSISMEDYLNLYQHTYETIKDLFPQISIGSPTVDCSPEGLAFEREFLHFCAVHDCVPDEINLVFVDMQSSRHHFSVNTMACREFVGRLRDFMHTLGLKDDIPVHLPEYYYTFGTSPVCDGMVGAMLPLRITLQNAQYFSRMGYWVLSDMTTGGTSIGARLFSGAHGIFTVQNGRKSIYYSLWFMSRLGNECLGIGDGYVITKIKDEVRILLYYDIPMVEQIEAFTLENAEAFYGMYPDRQINFSIDSIAANSVLIKEYVLNSECGSAFEEWLQCGGYNLNLHDTGEHIFSSRPKLLCRKESVTQNVFGYEAHMKPFEIRLVEISPC